jgi:hypothetical protein
MNGELHALATVLFGKEALEVSEVAPWANMTGVGKTNITPHASPSF